MTVYTDAQWLSAGFSDAFYLQEHPDVAAAGFDGLAHFVSNGVSEGRPISQEMKDWFAQDADAAYRLKFDELVNVSPGELFLHYKLALGADKDAASAERAANTASNLTSMSIAASALVIANEAKAAAAAGADGADGAAGADGADGAAGAQGPTGAAGAAGLQGPAGATGLQGPTGTKGDAGQNGQTGQAGQAGIQGQAGVQGNQGLTGVQGSQGDAGQNGQNGLAGAQGVPGAPGSNGVKGDAGSTGPAGADGSAGAQGADSTVQGPQGPQGSTGPAGADSTVQGPTGSTGPSGADSTVQGPKGDIGLTGLTGLQGQDGAAASALSLFKNDLIEGSALNYDGLDLKDFDFDAKDEDGVLLYALPLISQDNVLKNCDFEGNNSAKFLLQVAPNNAKKLDLTGSNFKNCDMGGDVLTTIPVRVVLKDCSFENAILNNVTFVNVVVANAPRMFKGAKLQQTYEADNSTVKRAKCILPSVALDHADFRGADLREVAPVAATTFHYADFTGAKVAEARGVRQFDMNTATADAALEGAVMRNTVGDLAPEVPTGHRYLSGLKDSVSGASISALVGEYASSKNLDLSGVEDSGTINLSNQLLLTTNTGVALKLSGKAIENTTGTVGDMVFPAGTTASASGTGCVITLTWTASSAEVTNTVSTAGTGYVVGEVITIPAAAHPFGTSAITATVATVTSGAVATISDLSIGATAQTVSFTGGVFAGNSGGFDGSIPAGGLYTILPVRGATTDFVVDNVPSIGADAAAQALAIKTAIQANITGNVTTLAADNAAATFAALTVNDFHSNTTIVLNELEAGEYVNLGGAKFTASERASAERIGLAYNDMALTYTASPTAHIVPTMSNAAEVTNADLYRSADTMSHADMKTDANAGVVVYKADTFAAWKWRAMNTIDVADDDTIAMNATDTTDVLLTATYEAVDVGEYMLLDSELVKVVNKAGSNTITMIRAQGGTTAAAHNTSTSVVVYKKAANRLETRANSNVKWAADYGDLYLPPFAQSSMYLTEGSGAATISAATGTVTIGNIKLLKAGADAVISQKSCANDGLKANDHEITTLNVPTGMMELTVYEKISKYQSKILVGPNMDLRHLSDYYMTATPSPTPTDAEKTHDFGIMASLDGCNLTGLYVDVDQVKSMNDANLRNAYVRGSGLNGLEYAERLNIHQAQILTESVSTRYWRADFYAKGIKGELQINSVYQSGVNQLYHLETIAVNAGCLYGPGIDFGGCTFPVGVTAISKSLEDASLIGISSVSHGFTFSGSLKNAKMSSLASPTTFQSITIASTSDIAGADFSGINCNKNGVNLFDISAAQANPASFPIFTHAKIQGAKLYASNTQFAAVETDAGVNKPEKRADFRGADISGGEINNTNFKSANFGKFVHTVNDVEVEVAANLSNVLIGKTGNIDMDECSFKGANCSSMKAASSLLESATKRTATLTNANFSGATITGMQIKNTDGAKLAGSNFKGMVSGDNLATINLITLHTDYTCRADKSGVKHVLPNAAAANLDLSDQDLQMDFIAPLNFGVSNMKNLIIKNCNVTSTLTFAHAAAAGGSDDDKLKGFAMRSLGQVSNQATVGWATSPGNTKLAAYFGLKSIDAGKDARDLVNGLTTAEQLPATSSGKFMFLGSNLGAIIQATTGSVNASMYGGNHGTPVMNLAGLDIKDLAIVNADCSNLNFRGAKYSAAPGAANFGTQCTFAPNYRLFNAANARGPVGDQLGGGSGANVDFVVGPGVEIKYAADMKSANFDKYVLGDSTSGMKFGDANTIVSFAAAAADIPSFKRTDLTNVNFGTSVMIFATGSAADSVNFRGATLSGTDLSNAAKGLGKYIGVGLTESSNASFPTASSVSGKINVTIVGTVEGSKKLVNTTVA